MSDNRPYKILFLNPTTKHRVKMEIPDDIMDEMGDYPPLGLVYLATYLKEKCKYPVEVKLVDSPAERMNLADIENIIKEYSPDMLAVTTFTPNIVDALLACDIAKKVNPDIKTFLGGHHTDSYPVETLAQPNVDMICRGEGEETMLNVVETIIEGRAFGKIPGFGYLKDGKPVIDMSLPFVADLDSIPLPDRSLLKSDRYGSILGSERKMASVITSRGCPNLCTYCYCPTKKYRARSIPSMIRELKQLRENGIREIYFFDDLFNITAKRIIDLSQAMLDEKLDMQWSFRGRVSAVSEEMMTIAKKAGCDRIHYGVETSDERRLKIIKKNITIDMVKKAVAMTRRHGITVICNFMIGLPEETKEDMLKTLRFMRELDLDYSELGVLIPFPNTELYRDGLERGIIKKDFWKEFADDPKGRLQGFRPQVWTEHLTQEELYKLASKGFAQFYMRPSYILKRLMKIRSLKEFTSMAKGGFVLLKETVKNA